MLLRSRAGRSFARRFLRARFGLPCRDRFTRFRRWLMAESIPSKYADLLEKPAFGNLGTLRKEGSPEVPPVWVDYDGQHIRINSARGRVKDKNIRRDPRVAISLQGPANP